MNSSGVVHLETILRLRRETDFVTVGTDDIVAQDQGSVCPTLSHLA
jgi:hypothetical protein